ncbi:ninein homolog [Linepithema humile]|uniref:ninein homolog n=1 Tax=Linepithema humile TaxID=83485 RepID=UPI000623610C|nr:PREDICTED: cingulin-like [Linepithema humile]XP_012218490.1 PREDICTED: cingulin-like [Linepithema humile]
MAEHGDLYEQQLFDVFESCLTKGEDELDESDLISICNKLHLDGLIEELKSCISKRRPDKRTISFQEFRDGLLLLLKKFQGLIMDKQHIVQPCYNSSTRGIDIEKSEVLSVNSISKIHLQAIQSGVPMDESRLMRLWEKTKVCLKGNADAATMQLISSCLGIPELPKQIAESIFEWLDQNCDGLISFDEFVIIFQKSCMKASQENNSSHNSIVQRDVNTLDFNAYKSRGIDSIQANETLDKREVAGVSNVTVLSSSEDLNALNTSLAEVTNIICDDLKNLNESPESDTIQSHIDLLQEIVNAYQEEQRNLNVAIENMKTEKEKMRVDILEANERANLLAQEIEEYQVQLEKTKESVQKQSEQRYAEITKDLLDQLNAEREMDAAALKSRDDQLQTLQKENHDMKNKVINMLQENQMLEAENKTFLNQIDKLRQSNNDLLNQIKILDAEQDEIQSMEARQQEQVDFFIDRIKHLQSEVTLLRDYNDELNAELENSRSQSKDTSYDAPSSLAYDLQLDENQDKSRITQEYNADRQIDQARASFGFGSSITEEQTDVSNATEYKRFRDTIIKDLENVLASAKCVAEKCHLRDGISRLITGMQSNSAPRYSARDAGKSIASELEMECEERANESLRDLVVSKVPKLSSAKRAAILSSTEDLNDFTGSQDVKNAVQSKTTSLRDYPPRKEEQHSVEQCKTNKEKNSSSSITEIENIPKIAITAELIEAEKKQLIERCQELERSLDLLKAEYEECEDYWAAKLEEERQLFEQEQKLSDDKLAELINKIAEYEELISPSDKSKNNGRLSPIEEKFNLEQQYVDLEDEFEKWKIKTENDISQKNLEIGDLREKLKLTEQPVTNDSYVQVPDELSLPMLSDSSRCKSSSTSSIPSINDLFANIDLCTNNQTYRTLADFPLSSDHSRPLKQEVQIDGHNLYKTHVECPVKGIRGMNKDQKAQIYQNNPHIGAKTMLTVKEEDRCDGEFKLMHDVKETSYPCTQNNAQQHVSCVHMSVLQELKIKLYEQERKKRHLQRYIKQKRHYIEKLLQRVMMQHQTEVFELQCLLRNTQEKLQIQIQTTVDQADKLASADILVKDLYIENACLTAHMKRLQERCLVLSGLDVGSTSM